MSTVDTLMQPLIKLREQLGGPRFIDPPLRIMSLVLGLVSLTPGGGESSDPIYVSLRVIAAILTVLVSFFPYLVGPAAFLGVLVFPLLFPTLINVFTPVTELAAAMVLTYLNWRVFIIFTALAFIGPQITALYSDPATIGQMSTSLLSWLLLSLLALFGAIFENTIQKEVDRREEAARQNQAKLEQFRIQFVLDTHDTVAHGLASEAAILKMMGREISRGKTADHQSRLMEVSLINAHTQQQLRSLLTRLKSATTSTGDRVTTFEADMHRTAELIMSATEAGGFDLLINIGRLPHSASVETLHTALFLLREMATNIIKHSASRENCFINVWHSKQESRLVFQASNAAEDTVDEIPLSLSSRAEQAGGESSIKNESGVFTITAKIPIRRSTGRNTSYK